MVIGDPYQFAVIVDEIPRWNPGSNTFRNGILLYCINGILFPKEIQTAVLSSDLSDLIPRMCSVPSDDLLFFMEKDEAFRHLYNTRFGLETEEDYRFDLTPYTFADIDHYVFAVKGNAGVRLLVNSLPYVKEESMHDLSALNTLECVISHQEYEEILEALNLWSASNQ